MPEAVIGGLIGSSGIVFVGLLGAIVKLVINGRRSSVSGAPSCPAAGSIAAIKQDMVTFHPRLDLALSDLARTEVEQTAQLVRIATILDERMPKGGER